MTEPQPTKPFIDLKQWDIDECTRIGRERNDMNAINGTHNMRFSKRGDEAISIQGVLGEWAFIKMHGLPLDPIYDTTCRSARNDTFDAHLPPGPKDTHPLSVDVKTVLREGCPIYAGNGKRVVSEESEENRFSGLF